MRLLLDKASWPTWLGLACVCCLLTLAALVVAGATRSLDVSLLARLRPDDVWGAAQVRDSPWMGRLEPRRMYLLLGTTALAVSASRRSWRPVAFGMVLAGASVASTVVLKLALQRPDPHGWVSPTGGSYPSGHVVAVLVCGAGCLLIVWPRVRWWLWAPVLFALALMVRALLVSAAHWPSDVIGGCLLALAVVSLLSRVPLRQPTARTLASAPAPSAAGSTSEPEPAASAVEALR